jgi:hypothetical protein
LSLLFSGLSGTETDATAQRLDIPLHPHLALDSLSRRLIVPLFVCDDLL